MIASIIQKATKSIDLVDGYVDVVTLNLLAKKKKGVGVKVYTFPKTNLSQLQIFIPYSDFRLVFFISRELKQM